MKDKRVSIIGLGLIGGSLARALHEKSGISDITAVDPNNASLEQAVRDGCISRGFNEVNEFVLESDVIFICTPVKSTAVYIEALSGKVKPGCIITDVGSTKSHIIEYVNRMESPPCFIGGHPMAGTEKTGYSAGFAHLFENAYYILTPCNNTTDSDISLMTRIVESIGGIPVILDADEHDRITGGISHVPHIVASALVNLVREMDSNDGRMQMLAAGGFKDITRIASSNPEIWESITLCNRKHIAQLLEAYISALEDFRENMDRDDAANLYRFFDSARMYRNSIA